MAENSSNTADHIFWVKLLVGAHNVPAWSTNRTLHVLGTRGEHVEHVIVRRALIQEAYVGQCAPHAPKDKIARSADEIPNDVLFEHVKHLLGPRRSFLAYYRMCSEREILQAVRTAITTRALRGSRQSLTSGSLQEQRRRRQTMFFQHLPSICLIMRECKHSVGFDRGLRGSGV